MLKVYFKNIKDFYEFIEFVENNVPTEYLITIPSICRVLNESEANLICESVKESFHYNDSQEEIADFILYGYFPEYEEYGCAEVTEYGYVETYSY